MSEIQETVQIIEISAKGGYWGVRIAKEAMPVIATTIIKIGLIIPSTYSSLT